MQTQESNASKLVSQRSAYRTPKLARYGQLAALTAGGQSASLGEGASSGIISPQ